MVGFGRVFAFVDRMRRKAERIETISLRVNSFAVIQIDEGRSHSVAMSQTIRSNKRGKRIKQNVGATWKADAKSGGTRTTNLLY